MKIEGRGRDNFRVNRRSIFAARIWSRRNGFEQCLWFAFDGLCKAEELDQIEIVHCSAIAAFKTLNQVRGKSG